MELNDMIRAARGDVPADLVLRNARLVNVYSGEIYPTDVAIFNGRIVGIGPGYSAQREIDLKGSYLAPGLIDAHVHIESAMVGVRQFAAAVVPRGVTSVIADPHEITNVLGLDGIRYMFDQAKYGQLSMFVMVPSCVPATHMATAGAYLEAKDIASLQNDRWVLGLAEMMNYPGVVREDPVVLEKLDAFKTRVLDGHAPGLSGRDLNAYVAAGIGSDHECTNTEEALEKLRLGMYILIREATNAHNLGKLLPMITPDNRAAHLLLHRRPPPGRSAGRRQRRSPGAQRHSSGHRCGDRHPHGDPQPGRVVPSLRSRRHPARQPRRPDRLRRSAGIRRPAGDPQRAGGGGKRGDAAVRAAGAARLICAAR